MFCTIWQQGGSGLEYPLQDVFSLPRYRRDNFVTGNCELIFYHINFKMFILLPELGKNVNPSRESDRFSYPNSEQFEIFLIVISLQKSKERSNCNDLKVQNIAPAAG